MADTKLKLLKILEILQDTDEEHPLTASQIGEKLKLYGLEAERKAICCDINILKDDAGYDILLSPDNKLGYYMASRDFEDWEIKVLMDGLWSRKFLTKANTEAISTKLLGLVSKDSQKMLRTISPVETGHKNPNPTTKINIDSLLKAIKHQKKVSFQYTYHDIHLEVREKREGKPYLVNPYSLIWKNECYYLVGNYEKYDNLSTYRLDRMKNLVVLGDSIKSSRELLGSNPDLQIQDYLRTSLYHYNGEKIHLTLEVAENMVGDLVDFFGLDLHFTPYDDKYRVTVEVLDGKGLYYWLLQYEDNVKVISPQHVKEKLLEKIENIK